MRYVSAVFISILVVLLTWSNAHAATPPLETYDAWKSPKTGKTVGGPFLRWFKDHCDVDFLGHPTTELKWDLNMGRPFQDFERGTLEFWDNHVTQRMVVDQLSPNNDPPGSAEMPDSNDYQYFPTNAGFGHAVRNQVTQEGQTINIGFKEYFDRCGGVGSFGYPKEEAKQRYGVWTQRFQAAVFQYFPENDSATIKAGTTFPLSRWKVQPAFGQAIPYILEPPMPLTLMFVNPEGTLFMSETRWVHPTSAVMTLTLVEMLKGPQDRALRATIHPSTKLIGIDGPNRDGLVTVNLSNQFIMSEQRDWAVRSITIALMQTKNVKGVRFRVEGKPLEQYWGAEFAKVFSE